MNKKPNFAKRTLLNALAIVPFAMPLACSDNDVTLYTLPEKLPPLPAGKTLLPSVLSQDILIQPNTPTDADEYFITFTNTASDNYKFPAVAKDTTGITHPFGKWGSKNNDLHFLEPTPGTFPISLDDYIILSDGFFSQVLRYTNHDPSNNQLDFDDLGNGFTSVSYDPQGNFSIVRHGTAYNGRVDSNGKLEIDLNGLNGVKEGERVELITTFNTRIRPVNVPGYKLIEIVTHAFDVLDSASLPCPDEVIKVHIDASNTPGTIYIKDVNVDLTETAPGEYTGQSPFGLDINMRGLVQPRPEYLTITEHIRQ